MTQTREKNIYISSYISISNPFLIIALSNAYSVRTCVIPKKRSERKKIELIRRFFSFTRLVAEAKRIQHGALTNYGSIHYRQHQMPDWHSLNSAPKSKSNRCKKGRNETQQKKIIRRKEHTDRKQQQQHQQLTTLYEIKKNSRVLFGMILCHTFRRKKHYAQTINTPHLVDQNI